LAIRPFEKYKDFSKVKVFQKYFQIWPFRGCLPFDEPYWGIFL
jgi:hypothetical protein